MGARRLDNEYDGLATQRMSKVVDTDERGADPRQNDNEGVPNARPNQKES